MTDQFEYYRPEGGFYLWLNVGNGEKAARRLWTVAGVKVIPGKYLSNNGLDNSSPGDNYIRIALVQESDLAAEALKRIVKTI